MNFLINKKTKKGGKTNKKATKKVVKKTKPVGKKIKKEKSIKKKQSKKKSSSRKKRKPEVITIETIETSIEPELFAMENNMQQQKDAQISKILEDVHNPKKPKLVLIYANWCGHCQAMKPNWEQMKTNLLERNMYSPEDIIEIESAEQEQKLPELNNNLQGAKIEIVGYPTMGKIEDGGFNKYEGGRDTESLMGWAMYFI